MGVAWNIAIKMKKIRVLGIYTNFKEKKDKDGKITYYHSGVDLVRTLLPLKYLDPDKFEVDLQYDLFSKYKSIKELTEHYDVILFSYIHDPQLYIEIRVCALKSNTKLVMDIDDDIWDVDPTHPNYKNDFQEGSENMFNRSAIIADVDKIITTNSFLRYRILDHVRRDHKDITIIPNFVDLTMYDHKKIPKKVKSDEIVIGWMGGSSHFRDINKPEFTKALKMIMDKYPQVRFKTTAYYPQLKALFGFKYRYTLTRFSVQRFIDEVWPAMASECDVFCAPLVHTKYSASKSWVKALEYGAAKKPVILENFGPYKDFGGHNPEDKGVFLADSTQEWFDALEKLILDEKLRKEMGERLYNEVKNNHTIQGNKNIYEEYLTKLIS